MGCVNSNSQTNTPVLISPNQNDPNPVTIPNPLHQPYTYINTSIPSYTQPTYTDPRISQNLTNLPQLTPFTSSMMLRSTSMNINNGNFYVNGQNGQGLRDSNIWALRES